MIYVIGDIHGCYAEFTTLLDKLDFTDSDVLYVLGDVIDRGAESIELLQDLACRPNVYPVMGNHEYLALSVLRHIPAGVKAEGLAAVLPEKYQQRLREWLSCGGAQTLAAFFELDDEEREDIVDYLGEFALYEEVSAGGTDYVLVHGALDGFSPEREMDDYAPQELISGIPDYSRVYFPDKVLVTGHSPEQTHEPDKKAYRGNNHLGVDCGLVYGGNLCAVCLDNGREYHVRRG